MNDAVLPYVGMLALGFGAGILSGMFGIGGGLVIVPALVILAGVPIKAATGTSLFALLWPVGLLGVYEYWKAGQIRAGWGAGIAVGLLFGAYFGARITLALSPQTMKRLYAVFLLTVGLYYLWMTRPQPAPATPPPAGTSAENA